MAHTPNKLREQPQQSTCEHQKGKQKKQQEKAAYYQRNPHLKWGK